MNKNMPPRKFYFLFFTWIVILYYSTGMAVAAVISPNLRDVLDSLGTYRHVPVIINLADKIYAQQFLSVIHPLIVQLPRNTKEGNLRLP